MSTQKWDDLKLCIESKLEVCRGLAKSAQRGPRLEKIDSWREGKIDAYKGLLDLMSKIESE